MIEPFSAFKPREATTILRPVQVFLVDDGWRASLSCEAFRIRANGVPANLRRGFTAMRSAPRVFCYHASSVDRFPEVRGNNCEICPVLDSSASPRSNGRMRLVFSGSVARTSHPRLPDTRNGRVCPLVCGCWCSLRRGIAHDSPKSSFNRGLRRDPGAALYAPLVRTCAWSPGFSIPGECRDRRGTCDPHDLRAVDLDPQARHQAGASVLGAGPGGVDRCSRAGPQPQHRGLPTRVRGVGSGFSGVGLGPGGCVGATALRNGWRDTGRRCSLSHSHSYRHLLQPKNRSGAGSCRWIERPQSGHGHHRHDPSGRLLLRCCRNRRGEQVSSEPRRRRVVFQRGRGVPLDGAVGRFDHDRSVSR